MFFFDANSTLFMTTRAKFGRVLYWDHVLDVYKVCNQIKNKRFEIKNMRMKIAELSPGPNVY